MFQDDSQVRAVTIEAAARSMLDRIEQAHDSLPDGQRLEFSIISIREAARTIEYEIRHCEIEDAREQLASVMLLLSSAAIGVADADRKWRESSDGD